MTEKTFFGTFTAIALASVPIWGCGLVSSRSLSGWEFAHTDTVLASLFWIPLALLTFVALWVLRERCRCKPALLVMATGVVPFAMVSSFFLIDGLLPVLQEMLEGEGPAVAAAFMGLMLAVQAAYVATSYIIAGGRHRHVTF